jgi:hypothetical protein
LQAYFFFHIYLLGDYHQPFADVFPDTLHLMSTGTVFVRFVQVKSFYFSGDAWIYRFPTKATAAMSLYCYAAFKPLALA